MDVLYNFPKTAEFGRVLPKSKIYQHSTLKTKVKELFVLQVEKITWSYKLSPETINIPASKDVQEIQVFTIDLRIGELSFDILKTIDKAIPSPILFILKYNGKYQYAAAYKRLSEADKSKWVISQYLQSEWISNDSEKVNLPVVLNMEMLYQSFLKNLSPLSLKKDESLDNLLSRVEQLHLKKQEAIKLQNRIKKEKQFNRRVELNRTLNKLKSEIEKLQK